jgi:hypothetical protein
MERVNLGWCKLIQRLVECSYVRLKYRDLQKAAYVTLPLFPASSGIEEISILEHAGFVLLRVPGSASQGTNIQKCVIPDEALFPKVL